MKWSDFLAITILDEQLKIGQVKSVTSDFGRYIDYVSLLFSNTTKAEFQPNEKRTGIVFSVSDSNFDLPEMVCELNRDTVRNLIVSLKNMYNQLELEDTANNSDKDKTENKTEKPVSSGCCRKKIL